jgi:hypothetical protein
MANMTTRKLEGDTDKPGKLYLEHNNRDIYKG